MPAVTEAPEKLVLLTGAGGFLACHVGQQLLKRGFRVRGTVRTAAKGAFLKALYEADGLADKFEFVVVDDVAKPNCFESAVKGVAGIIHTASPFPMKADSPYDDIIKPAIQGTRNALEAASTEPSVQRVVVTSSFAAVGQPHDFPYEYTEADWNDAAVEAVKGGAEGVPIPTVYRASKTLAEKEVWRWIEEEQGTFDAVTILPPLIFGPILQQVDSLAGLNTSVKIFHRFLTADGLSPADALAPSGSYVDVRDVARCHIDALVTPAASNKRLLVSAEGYYPQLFLDVLHAPENASVLAAFPSALVGEPGAKAPTQNTIDSSLARSTLGWTPLAREETVLNMTSSLAQKSWAL